MMIQRYFASMGIDVEKGSIKKVDKALDHVENRLKKLGTFANKPIVLNIGNFDVDQKKLNIALGTALDMASTRLVFEVSRFAVNQAALNRDIAAAMLRASATHPLIIHPRVTPTGVTPGGRAREAAVTGAVAGGVSRTRGMPSLLGPAIALGLGGYGLNALNKRNQEVVSAQLQTQAVITGNGGTAEQGEKSFDWLRKTANRVGFNYLDASSDFNVLTSNLLGSGGTIAQSQNIFKGFAEYGRVNKLSPARQKLVFNALSQIAGKDKLQAEELTKQLGNSLPGAKNIFAQAWQQKIGGNLTGSEAIIALEAAMKKGQVRGDILNYAANIASQKAQPGLVKASQASQAEQARYQNAVSDMAIVASDAGVEEGFARIFRTLSAGLNESGDLVKKLAEGFNEATKYADDLLLWPQSFVRALEGKDSLIGDWLGVDKTGQLVKDWQDIKLLWDQIMAIKPSDTFGNFLPTIEATTREIAGIMGAVASFKQWNDNASASADIVQMDIANRGTGPVSNFAYGLAGSLAGASAYVSAPFSVDESSQYKDYVANEYSRGAQSVADQEQLKAVSQNFEFQINLNIDPVTMAQMDVAGQADALANEFKNLVTGMFEQASVQFPVKE